MLHRLVDRGNTVLVIEHNLDVIKTADWIIDLGPEGGTRGGTIVAAGTPEDVVRVEASHTGRYLKPMLKTPRAAQEGAADEMSSRRTRSLNRSVAFDRIPSPSLSQRHMVSLLDIIGPVMVGPSSSHTAGACRLGLLARCLVGGTPQRATRRAARLLRPHRRRTRHRQGDRRRA